MLIIYDDKLPLSIHRQCVTKTFNLAAVHPALNGSQDYRFALGFTGLLLRNELVETLKKIDIQKFFPAYQGLDEDSLISYLSPKNSFRNLHQYYTSPHFKNANLGPVMHKLIRHCEMEAGLSDNLKQATALKSVVEAYKKNYPDSLPIQTMLKIKELLINGELFAAQMEQKNLRANIIHRFNKDIRDFAKSDAIVIAHHLRAQEL